MQLQQRVTEIGSRFASGSLDSITIAMIAELVAAVREEKLARAPLPPYTIGEIEIDEQFRVVRRGGREVSLRPKEYELLIALARKNGVPASKRELLEQVWQIRVESESRTLDQHMFELRRKLEKDKQRPQHFITIRKFGYALRRD